MKCPFCGTQILPEASACTGCPAYLSSQARTPLVLLSAVGYLWLEYEAFTHLSFSHQTVSNDPVTVLAVIVAIVVIPWVFLAIMFKIPMLRKTVWLRRL
jgi:hypothetical protein